MSMHVDFIKDSKVNYSFHNAYTKEDLGCGEYTERGFELLDSKSCMILLFDSAALAWKYLNDRLIDFHGF